MSETTHSEREPPASVHRVRRWRWLVLWIPAIGGALVALLVLGGFAFLASDAGVAFAVRELELRSGGHLAVEGASGSLLSEVHVRRLAWHGPATSVVASDVVLTWTPAALWSRGLVVQTLGAQRIALTVEGSDTDVPPPASLTLPFDVTIEHLAVTQLDWQVGPNGGTIRGIAAAYAGGATAHRVTGLALGTDTWKLAGEATIGAQAPFAIGGALAVKGSDAHDDAESRVTLSGTLAALALDGAGKVNRARFTVHAAVAPLAAVPLADLALDAADVDLAAWNPDLPATRLGVVARTQQTHEGLAGSIEATNALPGTIDAGRVPLRSLATRFVWHAGAIDLDALTAELAGGGRARGRGRIALGAKPAATGWSLDVADIDLHALYAPLVRTRLAGTIAADLDRERQKVEGDVTERVYAAGIALKFTAAADDEALVIEQFRASAGASALAGRARVDRNDPRRYALDATATKFDPARFGSYPAGTLDGRIRATGVLVPAWRVDADVALDKGSRLAGVALAGTLRATIEREAVRNADIAVEAGSAKLTAKGEAGRAGDVLTVTLDVPRLAELVPLLPATAPHPLAGAVSGSAHWRGPFRGGGFDVAARGSALKLGDALAIATLDLDGALAPGAPGASDDLGARELRLDVRANELASAQGRFAVMRAKLDGTLAAHRLTAAFTSADVAVEAAARGGFTAFAPDVSPAEWRWQGTVEQLTGSGPLPVRLASPMAVALARERVHVGEASIAIADGTLQLAEFTWEEGRITTRGAVRAVPLATVARLAGVTLPFESTLTLGGEWAVAATPRLTGTASLRREGGDLRIKGEPAANGANRALGLTTLEVSARFADDAVDATATYASTRAGTASAKLAIGAVANAPPGRITAQAPLTLKASAELPTLALLQPWIGTTAVVDGRARADIDMRGTVGRIEPAGTLEAQALRIDAPQYGVHITDGRFRAHLAERNVALDEVVLHAGAGEFRAAGTVTAIASADGNMAAAIGWHASHFRLFNRPDLHLVVGGEGKLAFAKGKLEVEGKLAAEEGRIVYAADPSATLGDDVVVKGWPRPESPGFRAADLPLVVDLALDFGEHLTFASEGLDTGVVGTVRVSTGPRGFAGKGALRAVNGTYRAFGQKLVIDPGRLIFDGPLDNPGLDIVALRKNLAVEAGVKVSGTVRVPIIQLTSNPPVSDSEKLAWLVLGHGLDRTSGTDFAALQAASALLLGGNGKSVTASIAESVGLDDIALKQATTSRGGQANSTESQVVAFGKRLTENLTLVYEQGLSVATSAIKLEYALTRNLTVRAETGVVSGVGIQYHRAFE